MENAAARTRQPTEPGRITVQLLVACSAILSVVQLVAATSVDVYNGDRASWWVSIQGVTVTFSAAFAGAAAAANGAWLRRLKENSGSTTLTSILSGLGGAAVASTVFAVLVWASVNLPGVTYPTALAVLLAALAGGLTGSVRGGGAVLGGLVAVFVATLVDLASQAVLNLISFTPPGTGSSGEIAGQPVPLDILADVVAVAAGTVAGCWWLSRRRQHIRIKHRLVVGFFPSVLLIIANLTAGLVLALVRDDSHGAATAAYVPTHLRELLAFLTAGGVTALVLGLLPRRVTRKDGGDAPVTVDQRSARASTPGTKGEDAVQSSTSDHADETQGSSPASRNTSTTARNPGEASSVEPTGARIFAG